MIRIITYKDQHDSYRLVLQEIYHKKSNLINIVYQYGIMGKK